MMLSARGSRVVDMPEVVGDRHGCRRELTTSSLTESFAPLDIRRDRIVGVLGDGLEVERIAIFDIPRKHLGGSMPSKLARMFKRLTVEPVAFDPSVFGDDLARRTDWGPASGGGASFGTHRLVGVDPHRMEFKATPGAIAFYALFLVIGLAVLNGFSYALASGSLQWEGRGLMRLLPIALGATFAIVGGGMLYTGAAPIVFDRRRGEYWKGRVSPSDVADPRSLENRAELDRVRALQIISEYCRSKDSSYYSYELNLVLEDGTRLPVVDHGDRDRLQADTATLSEFLGKPIWDATA
jgi:hypothetical protein